MSQHRLRDLNLEAQIVPKCFPKGPLETLWTHLGQPLGARGGLLGDLGAPGTLFGGPWELCGAPRELFSELWGMILELSGTMLEAFWDDFRALFRSFLGRSGLHRSRSLQNGRDRSRLVNTNEIATCSLTRELANISGT